MGRQGRYVKRANKCTIPGAIFAVVVQRLPVAGACTEMIQTVEWGGAEVAVRYRSHGRYGPPIVQWFDSPDAMREWMASRALRGRTNWVVAPSADEALTLSRWWEYAERKGVSVRGGGDPVRGRRADAGGGARVRVDSIVVSRGCGIVDAADDGVRWRWVSASNYWPDAGSAGRAEHAGDPRGALSGGVAGDRGCRRVDTVAVRLAARVVGLCEWWRRIATAPLGRTAGQLAWGVLRSHVRDRTLCTHSDTDAHRLERVSAHGGRASVWYVGPVGTDGGRLHARRAVAGGLPARPLAGPVHHVDVSSMYPALLRDNEYPVSLRGVCGETTPADLIALARGAGVIARVRVDAPEAEWPCRDGGRTTWPVGRFTTTLAGPDLIALAEVGRIVKVYEYAYYNLGRPFADCMSRLLVERADADARGDRDGSAFAKLLANSVGGKLAQRRGAWVRASRLDEPGRWGEEQDLIVGRDGPRRTRWLLGAAWQWEEGEVAPGPHTSAFAYLTAYGRMLMRSIRRALPPRTVVSQDTDGLWLTQEGLDALASLDYPCGCGPGSLRVTRSVEWGVWYGPRHYCAGGEWTLSGYADAVVSADGTRLRYRTRTPLFDSRARIAPDRVHVVTREGAVPCDIEGGRIGDDGWVVPPVRNVKWREE